MSSRSTPAAKPAARANHWNAGPYMSRMYGNGPTCMTSVGIELKFKVRYPNLFFLDMQWKQQTAEENGEEYVWTHEEDINVIKVLLEDPAQYDELVFAGISTEELSHIVTFVQAAYTVPDPVAYMDNYLELQEKMTSTEDQVNRGKVSETQSTSTGRSSKRTSARSTT